MKIKRGSAKFHFGFSSSEQMATFFENKSDLRGISFLGRSNVGKSSLINALFGAKTARVSKTPGRTREINIFTFQREDSDDEFYLFDLPGYGHAEISKEMAKNWNALMDTFFSTLPENIICLNIQDARHPQQKADEQFHQYIREFNLNTMIAFNKIDKLKTQKERALLNKLRPILSKEFKHIRKMFFVSAESKEGLEGLELAILSELHNIAD